MAPHRQKPDRKEGRIKPNHNPSGEAQKPDRPGVPSLWQREPHAGHPRMGPLPAGVGLEGRQAMVTLK